MIIDCAVYSDGVRKESGLSFAAAFRACHADDDAFVWIGLYEPDEEEFASVTREFEIHPIAVEDAIIGHQRPKIEIYDDTVLAVLKPATYRDGEERIDLGEVEVFIGPRFVITVRHGEMAALSAARRRLEGQPDLLRLGPGAVLHAVVDTIVDGYAPVIRELNKDIQEIEREVFSHEGGGNPTERIYRLKRQVLDLELATAPLEDPLDRLARMRVPYIHADLREYFRDVHDHHVRFVEQVETFRDLLTSVLEANLTQVSIRQNSDMRKISAWVAIAAVPTMVAGIYGMNFEHMPELNHPWGYPLVLVIMAGVCVSLYRAFRRNGWL